MSDFTVVSFGRGRRDRTLPASPGEQWGTCVPSTVFARRHRDQGPFRIPEPPLPTWPDRVISPRTYIDKRWKQCWTTVSYGRSRAGAAAALYLFMMLARS
ncbi:hypothetical protein LY76DRAFT_586978 [Colletotrichum caudatum]|nr:hypothetical protein LY76DRAFT_586978 [Colletotrichum caudatum]